MPVLSERKYSFHPDLHLLKRETSKFLLPTLSWVKQKSNKKMIRCQLNIFFFLALCLSFSTTRHWTIFEHFRFCMEFRSVDSRVSEALYPWIAWSGSLWLSLVHTIRMCVLYCSWSWLFSTDGWIAIKNSNPSVCLYVLMFVCAPCNYSSSFQPCLSQLHL